MLCTDGKLSFQVPHFLNNKRKETGVKALHEYRLMAENQTGKKMKRLWIDGGGELNNGLVDEYCAENGIIIEKVPHDSSAANGVAERAFRTVMEGTRTLLEDAKLPYSFWGEAAATFIYTNNFIPSTCSPDMVPIKAWTKKRQDISHLRPFGCDCWATLPRRQMDGKLGRQAVKGKLLGYMGRCGYRMWLPEEKRVEESHNIAFEEGEPNRTRSPASGDHHHEEATSDGDIGPDNPGLNYNAGNNSAHPEPTTNNDVDNLPDDTKPPPVQPLS